MQGDLKWRFEFPPGYYAILNRHRNDCAVRRATKSPNYSTAGKPNYTAIPETPMRSIAMDVFAILGVTFEGERYDRIISAVDRHSGNIVAVPGRQSKKKDWRWHHRGPGPTQHLDNQNHPYLGATCPGQGHRAPTPRIPEYRETLETDGTHQPLAKPAQTSPRCGTPIQSRVKPPTAVHPPPRPDHGDQRTPGTVTGQHSTPTTKRQRGSRGSAGTRSQGRTPPGAARRVTFFDDTDSSQDGPGGRQSRQMSPTAEPQ